jgi:competence ComEA-like helix-hairpin-helix protein
VHSTPHARLALVWLLGALATTVLARGGEAAQATRAPLPALPAIGAVPEASASPRRTPEGDALRDGRRIDPNRASAAELMLLPGVGPKLAQAIVSQREQRGPFRDLQALRQVRGLGDKTLQKLRAFVTLGSEGLEHAAEAQRDVGGAQQLGAVDQQRGTHVEAADPAAREQVVEPDHQLPTRPQRHTR